MYRFDKISNIEQGPPQHLSHKPVMTMDAFRTTVLLRVAPMSEPETVSVSTFDSDADEKEAVAQASSDKTRSAELKEREAAAELIKKEVYGLREMRCHWERGFCYLVFSTFREAEYALKRLQAVAKDSDHALKGMVTNCYYI